MDLNFKINNQLLTRTDQEILVNKSKNYLHCNFLFETSDWSGLVKFALFKNEENETYPVYLGLNDTVSCIVPTKVLNGDFFKVSVYGGDFISTNEKTIVLLPAGYTGEVGEDKDLLVKIFERIEEKIDNVTYTNGILTFESNGVVLETISLVVDSELSTTSENPVQNKVITSALDGKAERIHNHVNADITDLGDAMDNDMNKFLQLLAEEIAKE